MCAKRCARAAAGGARRRVQAVTGAGAVAMVVVACGGKDQSPTSPTTVTATLTAPVLDSPAVNEQLDTLRPTLTVKNATADHTGTRTYEFQISDGNNFTSALTSNVTGFAATLGKTGIAEGTDGKTSWTADTGLQPTTVFY